MASTDLLTDGFSTTLTIANLPSVNLEVITTSLPGINGGGEIDLTTMSNTAYRTRTSKSLKSLDSVSVEFAYSTDSYEDVLAQVNVNQLFTFTLPDTTTLAFYGWIDSFVPGTLEEGSRPTTTMTIIPSLRNASGVETAPVYTIPSGAT